MGQEARAHPHENPGPETSHDTPNSELQLQVGLQDDKSESTMPSTAEPSRGTTPKERPTQTQHHTGCIVPASEGHNRQKGWRNTISRILNRNGRPTPEGRQRTAAPSTKGPKSVRHGSRRSTYDSHNHPRNVARTAGTDATTETRIIIAVSRKTNLRRPLVISVSRTVSRELVLTQTSADQEARSAARSAVS